MRELFYPIINNQIYQTAIKFSKSQISSNMITSHHFVNFFAFSAKYFKLTKIFSSCKNKNPYWILFFFSVAMIINDHYWKLQTGQTNRILREFILVVWQVSSDVFRKSWSYYDLYDLYVHITKYITVSLIGTLSRYNIFSISQCCQNSY